MQQLVELLKFRAAAALSGWRRASTHEDLVRWQTAFNEATNTIDLIEKPQPTLPSQR